MSSLPSLVPMKAVAGDLPPDDGNWAVEVKWDGMRIVAQILGHGSGTGIGPSNERRVSLFSANRNDVTASFPELADLADAVGDRDAVLDGEVVVFDERGVPSFSRLQQRMHVTDPAVAARLSESLPVAYIVFDLLHFDGIDSWTLPYRDRRRLLDELVHDGPHWQVPAARDGGAAELLEAARAAGLEGVVTKRWASAYEPGRRSHAWRKIKVRNTQELVVGGWTVGEGGRSGRVGSLMVGGHDTDGRLRWVGNVGSGFSDAALTEWTAMLVERATDHCPFDPTPAGREAIGARWVTPDLVVQVEFGEWTPDRKLRHPVFLGRRTDKAAADVGLEA